MGRTTSVVLACLFVGVSVSAQPSVFRAGVQAVRVDVKAGRLTAHTASGSASVSPVPTKTPMVPVGPCCPNEATYEQVIRGFAHGELRAAAIAIAHAPADQLKRAVSRLGRADPRLLQTAAAMHLILAVSALNGDDPAASVQQLRSSAALVQQIRRPQTDPAFMATWHVAATELCVAIGATDAAMTVLRQGLHERISGGLLLAEGIVDETRAAFDTRQATNALSTGRGTNASSGSLNANASSGGPGVMGPGLSSGGLGQRGVHRRRSPVSLGHQFGPSLGNNPLRRRAEDLSQAERAYRQALKRKPTSEEARLRLGRVLSLEGKSAEARRLLNGLTSSDHDARIVYLAHLFLAELAVRQKDDTTAVREYTAALTTDPSSQAAYFGLSNLAQTSGNDDRARHYMREWLTHVSGSAPDPWIRYQMGIDQLTPHLNALFMMIKQ